MIRGRSSGGHRRTKKQSEGDPRKVRQTKQRAALSAEACTWPRCRPGCPECGQRCLDCGGEGGGGTMDPDVWIDCRTCNGTGRT